MFSAKVVRFELKIVTLARLLYKIELRAIKGIFRNYDKEYMKKDKVTMFAEESYNDLDDNIGIVMPILTDCDVDEDFTEGIERVGEELPILPLRNMVLFPGVAMPVMIGRPKSMRLIKEAAHKKSLIGVVCQKDMNTEDPKLEDLYTTGVVADIVRVLEMPDGTTTVILQGKKRFQLEELSADDPYLTGKIKLLEDVMPDKSDREFEALVSTIKDLTIKMLGAASEPPRDLIFSIRNNKNILYLINFSCSNVPNGSSEKQDLLLIGNLKDRAYRLLFILNREYQLVELKTSIQMKTHEDINQQQKEYFLQQQIKTIQEELGGNINELEIKELREKAAKKNGRRPWPKRLRKRCASWNACIRNLRTSPSRRSMCRRSSICPGTNAARIISILPMPRKSWIAITTDWRR